MWVNSDAYIAPVKGYEEMKKFYMKMAKELDWLPGTMFGGNSQISQPMVGDRRKSAAILNGMPLLSFVSVGMVRIREQLVRRPHSKSKSGKEGRQCHQQGSG